MTLSQHVKELLDQFYEITSLHFNLKGCYAIPADLLINEPLLVIC
jgi:hypothetical protein